MLLWHKNLGELIIFLAIPGNKYLWLINFCGFLHSKTLHGLELISFLTILGNKCCHGNTFFLGLINIFMGSLLSISRHRLELISFLATPGNKCCHGNFGLKNLLFGFFSFQSHGLELISFSMIPVNKCCYCIPYHCTDCSWLAFRQHLAASVAMATLLFCFFDL